VEEVSASRPFACCDAALVDLDCGNKKTKAKKNKNKNKKRSTNKTCGAAAPLVDSINAIISVPVTESEYKNKLRKRSYALCS